MRNRVCQGPAKAGAFVVLACAAFATQAQGVRVHFDLPAQSLADSLRAVGSQTHTNVLFDPPLVAGRKAPALEADLTTQQALSRLLSGTGIRYEYLNETTVVLTSRITPATTSGTAGGARGGATPDEASGDTAKEGKTGSSDGFRLAEATAGQAASSASVEGAQGSAHGSSEHAVLDEVVVTAQKREEHLLDVPIPVTAVSAQTLVDNNLLRLQDYYTSIPNFNVTPGVQSSQALTIRGITSAGGNPTVAVLVDDAPFTASTSTGNGTLVPDIDPSDLARVEVLRGPQGALYGASSMGGLLKFVTVDPSTAGFSGHVQAGFSSVANGDALGYNFRASANVPLSDTLAVLVSGFTREDPGYVDNVLTGQNGINEDHAAGGHLSALWRPVDGVSLKVGALYQQINSGGSSDWNEAVNGYVGPPVGDLQQSYGRGIGPYDREIQQYSANLTARIGAIDLAAISAYGINQFADSFDLTYQFGPAAQALFGVGAAPVLNSGQSRKFSQEIRLSAPVGPHFDWLIGGFYTHEASKFGQAIEATVPLTGEVAGVLATLSVPTTYQEYAVFTDLTYKLSERFNIQFGGRQSRIEQGYTQLEAGPAVGGSFVLPQVDTSANVFTYLVTPQLKLSPDFMTYARLASGYRPGGPNASPGVGTPPAYSPDKTKNYEIGAKGELLDRRLTFDASLYYIDWNGIQISLLNNQTELTYNANGGKAKSEGAELSVEAKPLRGLTISGWAVWSDAVLTGDFPATSTAYGVSGDRLPYSSRFSGNLSFQEEFPLWGSFSGFGGAQASYRSGWVGIFQSDPVRQAYPGYTTVDLRAGAKNDAWSVNLFANNVTDRRAALVGGLDNFPPWSFWGIQPRTVGMNVTLALGNR
ncbi:MAG TPA: TonB-dependent receptor [Steroidobacteraceae bacterium]|nr:TonB-dependent receptor [Steroidobacteraceae bacterium]